MVNQILSDGLTRFTFSGEVVLTNHRNGVKKSRMTLGPDLTKRVCHRLTMDRHGTTPLENRKIIIFSLDVKFKGAQGI